MVYLIHFAEPFKHVQHYVGFTAHKLEQRLHHHRRGTGSKLMAAVTKAGIDWWVVRVWEDADGHYERRIKNRHINKHLCPCCGGKSTIHTKKASTCHPVPHDEKLKELYY